MTRTLFAAAPNVILCLALVACGGGSDDPAEGAEPSPSGWNAPTVDTAAWDRSTREGPAGSAPSPPVPLRAVRIDGQADFDRVIFEFDGALPRYRVGYEESPLVQCGSGRPVEVEAPGALVIRLRGAAAHDAGSATVADRDRESRLAALRSARLFCDFEGHVDWVLGLEARVPFRTLTLEDPTRLVIDLRHP